MTDLLILLDPISDFWKCLKKVFFVAFFNHIFDMFGLIGSVKTFSKDLGVGMNVGPYIGYILYKKGGFGGANKFHHKFLTFFGHFDHQN